MSWRLTTLDGTGRECVSAAVPTRLDAERWARDLATKGTHVVRITGPDGEVIELAASEFPAGSVSAAASSPPPRE